MSKYSHDNVARNIKRILRERNEKVKDFGEAIGISPSEVSAKCSENLPKKSFTLEQVFSAAEHFDISLDELCGDGCCRDHAFSHRDWQIELKNSLLNGTVSLSSVKVLEDKYTASYCDEYGEPEIMHNKSSSTYPCLYFSEYWNTSSSYFESEEDYQEAIMIFNHVGNQNTKNVSMNRYLRRLSQLIAAFKSGAIDKDTFESAIEGIIDK